MIYNFIFCEEYKSLIWGVIADSRANIPSVKDQPGSIIKSYVDSQTALAVPGVVVYKIEAGSSLAAYFLLSTAPGAVSVISLQLRPAFVQFEQEINQNIATFISGNNWVFDIIN